MLCSDGAINSCKSDDFIFSHPSELEFTNRETETKNQKIRDRESENQIQRIRESETEKENTKKA